MKVLVTLITYEDWVWSHPNPALVANYMLPGGDAFTKEVVSITHLAEKGWHADPSPTEIDWLAVTVPARRLHLINGKLARIADRPAYLPVTVEAVLNQKVGEYLNRAGHLVGHSPGGGRKAFAVNLTQGADARWRIINIFPIHMPSTKTGT